MHINNKVKPLTKQLHTKIQRIAIPKKYINFTCGTYLNFSCYLWMFDYLNSGIFINFHGVKELYIYSYPNKKDKWDGEIEIYSQRQKKKKDRDIVHFGWINII